MECKEIAVCEVETMKPGMVHRKVAKDRCHISLLLIGEYKRINFFSGFPMISGETENDSFKFV